MRGGGALGLGAGSVAFDPPLGDIGIGGEFGAATAGPLASAAGVEAWAVCGNDGGAGGADLVGPADSAVKADDGAGAALGGVVAVKAEAGCPVWFDAT